MSGYRDLHSIAVDTENRAKRNAGRAHLYALEIPMSVIIGAVLGKFVDDHFGIAPIGISVGLVAGLAAAIRAIVAVIAWQKKLNADDAGGAVDIGYDDSAQGRAAEDHREQP